MNGVNSRGGRLNNRQVIALWGFLFALPAIVFFGLFYVYPVIRAFSLSLREWNILGTPRYIGAGNFRQMFTSREFGNSVWVTVYYVFATVVPLWLISLPMAYLFNRPFFGRDLFITIYYLPVVVTLTVVCILWKLMYNSSYGLLTILTDAVGWHDVRWLNDPALAMPALILLSVWKSTPYYMVIFLAGLGSIPSNYIEAAKIDGARGMAIFWYVTLPILKPIVLYATIMSIINAFQMFQLPYILTGGGPGSATRVLPFYIYENAFTFLRMGYASAVSLVLFAILLLLTGIQLRLFRFGREEHA